MKKNHRIIAVGSVAILTIIVLISFVSFDKFGTFNFVRAGIGFAQIQLSDAEYIEISDSPRVVLTKDYDSFFKVIGDEGYEYIEQMGSIHTIEKDGKTELVSSRSNGYFTRWTWDK